MSRHYQKILLSLALILTTVFNTTKADVGAQLDGLIATGAFTYEPYANVTLNQVGRHAFSLARLRFTVPTSNINLIQWSPPSLDSSCNSISLNLGNFSFISLDEAISALRSIAAQSLTYGFGQAVQALCQPCWAGMKDLQNTLQRFNQAARNTCQWAQQLNAQLNPIYGPEGEDQMQNYMCSQIGDIFGDSGLDCEQAAASFSEGVTNWIDDLLPTGIDTDTAFVEGNAIYESYSRVLGDAVAGWNSAIPVESSRLFFGVPLNAAEVAMSLYGYSIFGTKTNADPGKDGYKEPTITSIIELVTKDHTSCATDEKTDCMQVYQCLTDLSNNQFPCMSTRKQNVINFFTDPPECNTLGTSRAMIDYITCHVDNLLNKMAAGTLGPGDISAIQLRLLAHMTRPEQAAFYIGEASDKVTLSQIARDTLSYFVTFSLLHDYLTTVQNSTHAVLREAEGIDNMTLQLAETYKALDALQIDINMIKTTRDSYIQKLRDNTTWQETVAKYSKSTAQMVAELNQARR